MKRITVLSVCIIVCTLFTQNLFAQVKRSDAFHAKYTLKEVAVFSRHNVRAPITDGASLLGTMTPHTWIDWTAAQSQLTLKGGMLETANGQFFRKWVVSEGLFEENARPSEDEVLFYANSKQRTIATARYFLTGFMPVSDLQVTWNGTFDTMNKDFDQAQYNITDEFRNEVQRELIEKYGEGGLRTLSENVEDGIKLIAKVLDLTDSPAYKEGKVSDFGSNPDHDMQFFVNEGKEPSLTGSVEVASEPGDALVLQYYQDPDSLEAAFGHVLTREDWHTLCKVKDLENGLRFSIPIIYKPIAQVFLTKIAAELKNPNRKFYFMCGHDTNVTCILNALDVAPYTVDNAVEVHVPIGSKLVFEKWEDESGNQFIAVNHVYQSVNQLRNKEQMTLDNPPMVKPLTLNKLSANEDGLYPLDEFVNYIENIDDTATLLENVKTDSQKASTAMYNIQGQRISSDNLPKDTVVISGGKKMLK